MAISRPGAGTAAETGEEIRRAAPSDLPRLLAFLEAAQLPTSGVAESLERFVLAESGGRLAGVAGLEVHGRDGVLRSVAVDPALRSRGLGARLTERVLALAREEGLRRVYLLTTTAEDYFPRHGFRRLPREEASSEVRQSVEFREACPASAVAMVVELNASAEPRGRE